MLIEQVEQVDEVDQADHELAEKTYKYMERAVLRSPYYYNLQIEYSNLAL